MRIWPLVVLAITSPAFAEHVVPQALTAQDVQGVLRPVSVEIERCYMERTPEVRGAGHLDLILTLTRHGSIEKLDVKTPGLDAKVAKDIDGCVRTAVAKVAFPAARTFTIATVPYYFQRVAAPSSGPQYSCWDVKGCHH